MDNETLPFGLEWDRDYFVDFVIRFRIIFWPISIFLVHPLTIFVLIFNTPMSLDCKTGYVLRHVILMHFDTYNSKMYNMYPMAPIPVFFCTGWLCNGIAEGTTLMTGLSFYTILMCGPYLFILVRMHQKMLFQGSRLKMNNKMQALVLLFLNVFLVANVFGFHYWAVEPSNKQEILNKPEVAWGTTFATNFLVLGEREGDIGTFGYELILLIVSIFINFSFYVFITHHAVVKIGKHMDAQSSKTREAQLRFIYSLATQAGFSAVLFILPLLFLFIGLAVITSRSLFPGWLVAPFRIVMVLAYNCSSIAPAFVFLSSNPWLLHSTRRVFGLSTISSSVVALPSREQK